jgi:hypothetical protein
MSKDALWQRWEGFLAKIAARQDEIIAEAEEGIHEIINTYPEDPMPLGNALQGLRFRFEELKTKVDETWEQQVEPKFEEVDDSAFTDKGRDRKQDFLVDVDEKAAMFAARMTCDFYRNLKPRAEAGAKKVVNCGGCGAPLKLATRRDTVSHKCTACGALNQVMAEGAVAQYQGVGHAQADLETVPLRYEIERFRIQVDRWRRAHDWAAEPIDSLDKWLAMERSYWEKFVQIKGAALGEPPDLELAKSRIDSFVDMTLKTDQRWRKAKGL